MPRNRQRATSKNDAKLDMAKLIESRSAHSSLKCRPLWSSRTLTAAWGPVQLMGDGTLPLGCSLLSPEMSMNYSATRIEQMGTSVQA